MVSAVDIERATRNGTIGFVGGLEGYDWAIRELKSGQCEVRVQHGGTGPESCRIIAKKAMWVNVPQIIADHINKEQAK